METLVKLLNNAVFSYLSLFGLMLPADLIHMAAGFFESVDLQAMALAVGSWAAAGIFYGFFPFLFVCIVCSVITENQKIKARARKLARA